jgi:hypothetical protein
LDRPFGDQRLERSLDDLASVYGGSLSFGETATAVLAGAGVVVAAGAALMAAPAVVGGAAAMGGAYLVAAGAGTAIGTVISGLRSSQSVPSFICEPTMKHTSNESRTDQLSPMLTGRTVADSRRAAATANDQQLPVPLTNAVLERAVFNDLFR